MSNRAPLLTVIAHARSGSLKRAWRLFEDAGFDTVEDDPAVLSVRGRLLKDEALASVAAEDRRRFYQQAAAAYARAGEIGGGAYPLINAATLSLLSGHRERSQSLARQVLDMAPSTSETPYYRLATSAEALLLLGDVPRARSALTEAVALAPRAYEDHASTLRQFGLILAELGENQAWLDLCRPPRSAHFAGHMAPADAGATGKRIRSIIKDENIGFAFGALAAGSDILIAEALLEAGSELHLILPAPSDAFREVSVKRFGEDWVGQFDEILAAASSVRCVTNDEGPPSPLSLQLAAEVAMGRAIMHADTLMTEAVQLLILEHNPSTAPAAGGSNWIRSVWERSGRRQKLLMTARSRTAEPHVDIDRASPNCLAAVLRIEMTGSDPDQLSREILPLVARALSSGAEPLVAPRWTGEAVLVAFETTEAAARAAQSIATSLELVTDVHIAGHYAIVRQASDPFGGEPLLLGPPMTILRHMSVATPSGAIHLTEDFAAALRSGPVNRQLRTEYVGELPSPDGDDPIRLFSFRA
ncbi:MAG: tetratricopeptide repeat-containing protein [Rhizomicrobium sp.]